MKGTTRLRLQAWGERLGAVAIGVVLLNVNVTDAGDPLSSVSGDAGPAVPGITPEAKAVLYAVLALAGVATALWSTSMVLRGEGPFPRTLRSLATAGALLVAAGIAGLALDHRDGPVRLVQLLVYVAVALLVIRACVLGLAIRRSTRTR